MFEVISMSCVNRPPLRAICSVSLFGGLAVVHGVRVVDVNGELYVNVPTYQTSVGYSKALTIHRGLFGDFYTTVLSAYKDQSSRECMKESGDAEYLLSLHALNSRLRQGSVVEDVEKVEAGS